MSIVVILPQWRPRFNPKCAVFQSLIFRFPETFEGFCFHILYQCTVCFLEEVVCAIVTGSEGRGPHPPVNFSGPSKSVLYSPVPLLAPCNLFEQGAQHTRR